MDAGHVGVIAAAVVVVAAAALSTCTVHITVIVNVIVLAR